ncbi:hypothetical protein GFC01_03310 [Desulfofundulus thermobenzoicus]|uniref:Transposase IS204/IS1001/IS1096/IS1165 DDE domain-containing protein n=1 Tax=Desulfofundulus thermobenzoicus TaxID=29376 RepID=A0A6N7IMU3_9FIRM|nr:transposase [Desulfofundulus thermobenzoicus]MQL51305.1 hypothetical protein [Desulfofundulus thermobenzoicus]
MTLGYGGAFAKDLREHKGNPNAIKTVCCDLSPAFIAGVKPAMPQAQLVFDRFHVMKIINEAVDEVRRDEARQNETLKKTRYIWLGFPSNKIFSLILHDFQPGRQRFIWLRKAKQGSHCLRPPSNNTHRA